jgi:hypothetical protein
VDERTGQASWPPCHACLPAVPCLPSCRSICACLLTAMLLFLLPFACGLLQAFLVQPVRAASQDLTGMPSHASASSSQTSLHSVDNMLELVEALRQSGALQPGQLVLRPYTSARQRAYSEPLPQHAATGLVAAEGDAQDEPGAGPSPSGSHGWQQGSAAQQPGGALRQGSAAQQLAGAGSAQPSSRSSLDGHWFQQQRSFGGVPISRYNQGQRRSLDGHYAVGGWWQQPAAGGVAAPQPQPACTLLPTAQPRMLALGAFADTHTSHTSPLCNYWPACLVSLTLPLPALLQPRLRCACQCQKSGSGCMPSMPAAAAA